MGPQALLQGTPLCHKQETHSHAYKYVQILTLTLSQAPLSTSRCVLLTSTLVFQEDEE